MLLRGLLRLARFHGVSLTRFSAFLIESFHALDSDDMVQPKTKQRKNVKGTKKVHEMEAWGDVLRFMVSDSS
jgi:hypothetical protein